MPISIPTSISGVSIPGAITGPLAKLFNNSYNIATYSYPRNLGADSTRRHAIVFTVKIPAPGYSPTAKIGTSLGNTVGALVEAAGQALTGQIQQAAQTVSKVSTELGPAIQAIQASDVDRISAAQIALYVPDTVNVQYSSNYNELSTASTLGLPYFLAQAGSSVLDKFSNFKGSVSDIATAVGDDPVLRASIGKLTRNAELGQLLTAQVGQALNPQLQVLFQGVGFRQFQFDFTLTPYSKDEADQINQIVRQFKLAAAPRILGSGISTGMMMEVPDRFEIKFLYDGRENTKIHKIGMCVLENINVDYAPIGWATFGDGNPVQTKLTLQFKEVMIIDKKRIDEGY
jgi:hypothetical protein